MIDIMKCLSILTSELIAVGLELMMAGLVGIVIVLFMNKEV